MHFPKEEYHLPFFEDYNNLRKLCPRFGEYFWNQNADQELCNESTVEGYTDYTFIGRPPIGKSLSLLNMRKDFLSFSDEREHTRTKSCLIVEWWRDYLHLVS